jgi:2-polyprenyl-6-methoxyphenol hydroxylase-like FAD-dependent oxidoreductase/catechol 2,3-dioxygenase-like lactoylglutathione lyase family enzyme
MVHIMSTERNHHHHHHHHHPAALDVDVAIVGYGPVGQALAGWLGRAGHRVAAFERFREIYRLPRAVHLDHEVMRLLQSLDVAEELEPQFVPVHDYEWFGADGAPLLRLAAPQPAVSGWASDYMFFQPALEDVLDRCARSQPTVTVERGWVAEGLVNAAKGAELTVRRVRESDDGALTATDETRTVRARWVVGADGANSFVREACGIARRDLGFQERWLVVDAEPHDMQALAHLPIACQWCDPTRPTTHVQSGPRHHRWEFMLLPGETAAEFEDPRRVRTLLEPFYRPEHGPVTRSAVYEFRSMLAERMRDQRVLLVGDAAHVTPPFLGQGLCSGLRDAANVAWKLDLVLRGLASEALLDTVDPERQPVNEWVINLAIQLGKVLCELDPDAAAERDAGMRAAASLPPLELAPLSGGLLHRVGQDRGDPLAGKLGLQGQIAAAGREGRFDDVAGRGFALVVASGDPRTALAVEQRTLLDALDATVVSLDPHAPDGIRDLDRRLTAWLQAHDTYAVLVRPDFYVFGSAASPAELPALLDDLHAQLGTQPIPPSNRVTGVPTMPESTAVIHPKFHHVNLKTTRLREMIDFYRTLVGVEVIHQDDAGAWMSNDEANHRVALLAFPNFVEDPEKDTRTGMHHSAFEYDSFEDLNASYLRLKHEGIEPAICLDHGMTLSYYYADPDGNNIELQVDCFGDWAKSKEWMRSSATFKANPIGQFVRPELIGADHANGMTFAQIHEKAMAGGYAPEQPPVEIPEMSS